MAKNHVYGKGTVITVACPTGGKSSGDIVVIRQLVGIALHDAVAGAALEIECHSGPVFTLTADNNLQIDVGDVLFYDSTNDWVDKTATSQTKVGVAVPLDTLSDVASATTATTCRVLVTGQTTIGA